MKFTFTVTVLPCDAARGCAGRAPWPAPQVLAVVELPNGVRLSTTIVTDDPAALHVGTAVVGVFDHADDRPTLLRFRPA